MHVVSWNVAGLRTTYERLKSRFGGLRGLMDALKADVLCLQEVKLSEEQLTYGDYEQRSDALDMFFCVSKKSGANGVATIARKGLTARATRTLDSGMHDATGRFLQTEHGAFTLINLYVNNDGPDGANVGQKMDFLLRVRQRVRALRAEGRRVIVAGDLNLKLRGRDARADNRSVAIEQLRASPVAAGEPELVARIRAELASEERWRLFCEKLKGVTANEVRNKYVHRLDGKVLAMEACEVPLVDMFKMEGSTAKVVDASLLCEEDKLAIDARSGEWIARTAKSLPLQALVAGVAAVFEWPETAAQLQKQVRDMGDWSCEWISAGRVCSSVFAQNLLKHDALVDSFALFHGEAKDRFTCWDQSRNQRYTNEGGRLDYILVDAALPVMAGPVSLYGCEQCGKQGSLACRCAVTSRESALLAAVAFGMWRPAPIDGSGISEGSEAAYASMVRPPHTGIVYTPPDWSDHVAVSALLQTNDAETKLQLQSDAATRECQPHTKQKKIVDLFARAAPKSGPSAEAAPSEPKKSKTAASEKFSAFFNKK